MAELGEFWRDVKESRKEFKAQHGIPCPECQRLQPKRNPTILLPQQRCKVDGYHDPRSRIDEVKQ
jgi:hypothetical protein